MSSIKRDLTGDVLLHDLEAEQRQAADPDTLARSGRSARTLVKGSGLRVTLVAIAEGAAISEHSVPAGVLIQPLEGTIRCTVDNVEHAVRPGGLLSLGPDVAHSVHSDTGGAFLLTIGEGLAARQT